VEVLSGRSVLSLDAAARTAKIQGGEEVAFDRALLATGAMVNILRVDGAQLEGIHYLRAFGNADSIRDDVAGAEHVVLIGGSYIAAEVAASLVEMGKRCSMVMMEEVALSGGFGEDAGRWFHELLAAKGVELHGGETLAAFEGDERVERVLTESGLDIACDAVVVGAGVRPDTMLAGRAGLEVGDGIVCDAGLETSVTGIFAAGDCASFESEIHGRRVRIEHWDVAMQQGRHAARGMLGDKRPYRVVPYFFSDLSDWAAIEYVGPALAWDEEVVRGDIDSGPFAIWYLEDGRVRGMLSVDGGGDVDAASALIAAGEAGVPG
jgi:3-phenylpropionate/trans-cinnamate dioxygenase ferredoxin reductase component